VQDDAVWFLLQIVDDSIFTDYGVFHQHRLWKAVALASPVSKRQATAYCILKSSC
jgi:hypothetical protein